MRRRPCGELSWREKQTIVWRVSLCGAIGAQLCIICM